MKITGNNEHQCTTATPAIVVTTISNYRKTTSRITVGNSTSLQLAVWAPGGNALVLVNQNNVYYKPTAETQTNYQITTTGIYGSIYNAVPDWVYEEEVFSSNKALWFSPSGKKMVFAYFDDTQTPKMEIPYYGIPGSLSFQYTAIIPIHYPKVKYPIS
ncbi:hypothetical protein PV325_013968 [Microctonus aethiopoides]|nr:hypothetical protein PV325_013968 [Microctonus aethiopoides]